jgi:hypothetical protein
MQAQADMMAARRLNLGNFAGQLRPPGMNIGLTGHIDPNPHGMSGNLPPLRELHLGDSLPYSPQNWRQLIPHPMQAQADMMAARRPNLGNFASQLRPPDMNIGLLRGNVGSNISDHSSELREPHLGVAHSPLNLGNWAGQLKPPSV